MKRLFVLFALVLAVFSLGAAEYLIDNASLLTESERTGLEARLEEVTEETGISCVIVTDTSSHGYTTSGYADYVIEKSEYGEDGVCFFINMGEREYYISTTGYAMYALDDNALSDDSLYDVLFPYLSDGEYYRAFTSWANYVKVCSDYSPRSNYENEALADDGEWVVRSDIDAYNDRNTFHWGAPLFFSIAIGAFISYLYVNSQRKKLKNVGLVCSADDYVVKDSFSLTTHKDIFLYSNVVRIRRVQDSSRGGGGGGSHHTTTHTSHSGASHGGRGGRF